MSRPVLEVADIFRDHGAAWRRANAGHVSLDQMKVMSAIERCRTASLGGHVARCEDCPHTLIAYNSCLMGRSGNGELAATWSCICASRRRPGSPLRSVLEERDQFVSRLECTTP
jgi:Transposase zinc-binding domain